MTAKTPPPTKKPAAKKPPVKKPTGSKPAKAERPRKSFSVASWDASSHGEKIVLYGKSGIGKTTLASMAPDPVFIGLDDGGRKVTKPDGTALDCIPDVRSVYDLRDALTQQGLFDGYKSLIIDNLTILEEVAEPYVVDNYTTSKGAKVSTFRGFGWDGPAHLLDTYRLILSDLDRLVEQGFNIVALAQLGDKPAANAAGYDYLEEGPSLLHQRHASVRDKVCQWADHVLRVAYLDMQVEKDEGSKVGKVTSGDATRAVFTGGEQHYIAKSRPVKGMHLPSVISFDSPDDSSLWDGFANPAMFYEDQETEE